MASHKDIFVIQKEGKNTYWHRCGVGFVNKDNSITLKLDLFPNVSLQVRDVREKDSEKEKEKENGDTAAS